MPTLVSKDNSIVDKLHSALEKSEGPYLKRDYKAIAAEYLAEDRAVEQIELFKTEINKNDSIYDLKEKKLLEIGAGVGTSLITARKKYGIDAYGIEPSEDEFSPFNEISQALLRENSLPLNIITKGEAEQLPFENESFDLIYSTNVLEHVKDPKKVIHESLRVLKKGGYLQFVIPNYFSFWEGHYGMLWPCLTNKFLAKLYVTFLGQKPDYIDTLNLISPNYLKKVLKKSPYEINVLSWGKEIFKKRLVSGSYSDWASLQKLRPIVQFVQKSGIGSLVANVLNAFGMYTPIILTIKKI